MSNVNSRIASLRRLRAGRRGSLLVVVLGLLVALFVIGTSFSYVTLTERRAATNYLDRQRALDIALDGVEYAIARLRSTATSSHYEGMDDSMFEYLPMDNDLDPQGFGLNTLETPNARVSWSRNSTSTAAGKGTEADGVWIDFNGDGVKGSDETGFGGDKFPAQPSPNERNFLSSVTFFQGEGICIDVLPPGPPGATLSNRRAYASGRKYAPSGTYEELGDIGRLKVIDTCSQFNLNNFKGQRLRELLLVMGFEIDRFISGPGANGRFNPFPGPIVDRIIELHDNLQNRFTNKEQLLPIYQENPELYEIAMNFVTVRGYRDFSHRDYAATNTRVNSNNNINPRMKTDMEFWREGFSSGDGTTGGRDGWADWQPDASEYWRAPVNINRATKPVLATLFAGLQARARMMYFTKADNITIPDMLQYETHNVVMRRQATGTTEVGRQNNQSTTPIPEGGWSPDNHDNLSVFQLVPIGPLSSPAAGATGTTEDFAGALADLIITERKRHPFTSWQDFDNRVLYRILLNMPVDRSGTVVPDLVGITRNDFTPQDVDGVYPKKYLPRADNVNHPANPLRSTNPAMTPATFRAWYWKSVVDMIRAALNPNNVVSRYNADYPYHQNVDRMDLTVTSQPICFSSMGVYEVVSQGELLAPLVTGTGLGTAGTAPTGDAPKRVTVARRQVRTLVEIYSVLRHTTQRDFTQPINPDELIDGVFAAPPTPGTVAPPPDNVVASTRYGTKSGPYSIDMRSTGAFNDSPDTDPDVYSDDSTYLGKLRKDGYNEYSSASSDFGYITQNPRDRSPFLVTQTGILNFHTRFNEGLNSRSSSGGQPMYGLNSANSADRAIFGAFPYDTDAVFDDFINSATPRSRKAPLGGESASEFAGAETGDETTRYATLLPDGVYLRGWHIREKYRSVNALVATYGQRGFNRPARLKILRYPCGAKRADNPFDDIENGPDDSIQTGAGSTFQQVHRRLVGVPPYYSGTDDHNFAIQTDRQNRSNVPYYEGTIDFWIKWDLPAQGSDTYVVSMGEVDPASNNFSGLFGATCFGRFTDSNKYRPAGATRDDTADFEGVQFFIFKEPAGVLRFSRLYFMEAWGVTVQGSQYAGGQIMPFGKLMRRIVDYEDAGGVNRFTATNDICVRGNTNDKGFRYARADAWVDLTNIITPSIRPLRPHSWYRLTIAYNSNSDHPYRLWLDGRQVTVEFHADNDIASPKGLINDGHHRPGEGQDMALNSEFIVARTSCRLLEINPEDRLTIGCIFRRQLNVSDQVVYDRYFKENATTFTEKPARPVFKFDSNFVAVANATIDDFRICARLPDSGYQVDTAGYRAFSRYDYSTGINPEAYFEHGFLATTTGPEPQRLTTPVRLGSLSWTEYRPDWEPYEGKGINLATSARVRVAWAIFPNVRDLRKSGTRHDFNSAADSGLSEDFTNPAADSETYWARGGIALKGVSLSAGENVGIFLYRVHFISPDNAAVSNVTAFLDDITLTMLTAPRKLVFNVEY